MKPDAFFELALWLIDQNKSAASNRSAISRGYYAAHHTAVAFLEAMGVQLLKTDNKHERVPDLLQHTADADLVVAGSMLNDLRSDRNEADYSLNNPDPE